jgi:hypothetical protein
MPAGEEVAGRSQPFDNLTRRSKEFAHVSRHRLRFPYSPDVQGARQ